MNFQGRSFDCGRRGDLRSATVCFVKRFRVWAGEERVMEKMENDKAVSHLSHNPGYDGWS
jgi:hypothetical protein